MPFPDLNPALTRALAARDYAEPTDVQSAVLVPDALGRDLLVSAQTGSGKTVAFGLAVAPTLVGEAERFGPPGAPLLLVIAPTRELAMQVKAELTWLYAETGARIASCVGGMDSRAEQRALANGAHIVVGTPGRLRDHLERQRLDLSALKAVILDEADEMLDLGFREDLEFILDATPAARRTLLFSATIAKEIAALARRYQQNGLRIDTVRRDTPHADIEYRAVLIAPHDVERGAVNLLRYFSSPAALVFCATRDNVRRLHERLTQRGFQAVALSGELSQHERTSALQSLRDGRASVCVATDVAARGLDLPDLDLVIHADLPTNKETLLHRSGRTGRAGRKGTSVLLVPFAKRRRADQLFAAAGIDAGWSDPPTAALIAERDQDRLLADPALTAPATEADLALGRLLLERSGPEGVAAALARSLRARLPTPEDSFTEAPPTAKPTYDRDRPTHRKTPHTTPPTNAAWFRISVGRRKNADPKWLIPLICRLGDITKAEIGSIRVFDTDTRFEIAQAAVPHFTAALRDAGPHDPRIEACHRSGARRPSARVKTPGGTPGRLSREKEPPSSRLIGYTSPSPFARLHSAPPSPDTPPIITDRPPRLIRDKLRPRLELFVAELPFDPFLRTFNRHKTLPTKQGAHRVPVARLLFQYGSVTLPASARPGNFMHEGELVAVRRDFEAEDAASERLEASPLKDLGFYHGGKVPPEHRGDHFMSNEDSAEEWIAFTLEQLPALGAEGWDIHVADDFPHRIETLEGPITADLRPVTAAPGAPPGSIIDWLDLELGVIVQGQRVDLVPALLKLIRNGQADSLRAPQNETDAEPAPLLLRLENGRLLAVPIDRIRPIIAPMLELFEGRTEEGPLRLTRFDAAALAAAEAATVNNGIVWHGGRAIRDLGRQLRDAGGIPPVTVPETFTATLRPYQSHGVDWMGFLRTAGLGGVLADDMGLGKTVQALAHLTVEQQAGRLDRPSLLVCPTSLVPNWRAEAARFAPTLRVLILHGPARAALFDAIADHDLVITTYPLLARDHETLAAHHWHIVLLDEAQTIKNPSATTSQLARTLQARQRLCLSGTPLENHLGELWSLFDFVMPGFLGDRRSFTRRFRTPIEKAGDTDRQGQLARRIAPFLLRRTKNQVAADLPPKTEIEEMVEMADPQRAVYEAIRLAMHGRVQEAIADRGLARSGIVILDALLKLRQVCCDPRLLKMAPRTASPPPGSAKLERLMEMLSPMLEEGRRVLLFSQFTSMLALIEEELAGQNLPYVILTGDTRDRDTPVRQFQAGEANLFLISLKAGGTGLNLTAADTVIHYDPWWNPAVEAQATDRAHRIGQQNPVFVHRLVTTGTIEEKMETLKARKQSLVSGILDAGPSAMNGITEADLEDLLGPLT